MPYHVLNLSTATQRRRDRYTVVFEVDHFLDGVKILKMCPGEKVQYSVEAAHVRVQELTARDPDGHHLGLVR